MWIDTKHSLLTYINNFKQISTLLQKFIAIKYDKKD